MSEQIGYAFGFGKGLGSFIYRMNPNLNLQELRDAVHDFLEVMPVYFDPAVNSQWQDDLYRGVGAGYEEEKTSWTTRG